MLLNLSGTGFECIDPRQHACVRPGVGLRRCQTIIRWQWSTNRGGMCPVSDQNTHDPLDNLAEAKDCLHLMLLEFGDVHIETLGQLLKLTNTAEREYSHICRQRLISG